MSRSYGTLPASPAAVPKGCHLSLLSCSRQPSRVCDTARCIRLPSATCMSLPNTARGLGRVVLLCQTSMQAPAHLHPSHYSWQHHHGGNMVLAMQPKEALLHMTADTSYNPVYSNSISLDSAHREGRWLQLPQVRSGSWCSSCAPINFLLLSSKVVFHASRRVMLSNSAMASVNCSTSAASNASARSCTHTAASSHFCPHKQARAQTTKQLVLHLSGLRLRINRRVLKKPMP